MDGLILPPAHFVGLSLPALAADGTSTKALTHFPGFGNAQKGLGDSLVRFGDSLSHGDSLKENKGSISVIVEIIVENGN